MFQQVILIGRMGQKKYGFTKTEKPFAQYSLATTRSYKDKQTGEWTEHTEWHQLVSFNQCAEHINEKIAAGDLLLVEGELRTRKWQDGAGIDRYTTEIVVSDFPRKLPRYFNREGHDSGKPVSVTPKPLAQAVGQDFSGQEGGKGYGDFDDDIPFAPIARSLLNCI